MRLRVGYELRYALPQPTPMILTLSVHYSRAHDLETANQVLTDPYVASTGYRDGFGNWCSRLVAPAGTFSVSGDFIVRDSGQPDPVVTRMPQVPIEQLPEDSLVFLLPSRFCESDQLLNEAWSLFGAAEPGAGRVRAICDFVHRHIAFGYEHARSNRTAVGAFEDKTGVCRDYAHLAVAFCRALNIPARYCTGYLGDVGTPPPYPPGDFAAWFEAYLGGEWHMFDPRNNVPRIGRVLMARGRDAADVAITTTFGPNTLEGFRVWTDEIAGAA